MDWNMYEYANGRVWFDMDAIFRWVRRRDFVPHYTTPGYGYENQAIDGLEYV